MIWCVEDDPGILEVELYTLRSAGFETQGFENGKDFREALAKQSAPELVILDIMLPGEDGFSLLAWLRSVPAYRELPVVIASARSAELDRIRGLEGGADYYLTKPFGIMELQSCVRAVLRRCGGARSAKVLTLGELTLDRDKHTAQIGDSVLPLTYKEFELLRLFLENPGIAFTRDRLFELVWGQDFIGESRTIDTHIQSLRKKLGPCGGIIGTVRNIGYRLEEKHETEN